MQAQLVFTVADGGHTKADVRPLSAVDTAGTVPVARPTQALSASAASAAARRIALERPLEGARLACGDLYDGLYAVRQRARRA